MATADLLNESFEGAGYENAWTENVGAGSTVDEDNADVARPTGGGSQILKIQKVLANHAARFSHALGAEAPIFYYTFYYQVAAHGLTDGTSVLVGYTMDTAWDNVQAVYLWLDGTNLKFLFFTYTGGAYTNLGSYPAVGGLSLDTWYKIGLLYDATNHLYACTVGVDTAFSGTIAETHRAGTKILYMGDEDSAKTLTAYYDLLRASSTGWVPDTTWIPQAIMVM